MKNRAFLITLFLILCIAILTERSLHSVKLEKQALYGKLFSLKEQKKYEEQTKNKLLKRIKSQGDPAWVELVLIRELGLLPEGQTKLKFKEQ